MTRRAVLPSLLVLCTLLALSADQRSPEMRFVDVAEKAGLDFRHVSGSPEKKYLPETFSGGIAWIDYNRDGWPDLYLVNGGQWEDLSTGRRNASNALYRNDRDGTFTNVTHEAGLQGKCWGMGATVGDFNNDGWPDLYVCNLGPNTLYRNNGDGTFSDVTEPAGVGDKRWSSSAAFGDYDGDGWLDLYVANYVDFDTRKPPQQDCQYRGIKVHCGPKGFIAAADVLYHNNRDGTFTDVSSKSGISDATPSYGLGVIWGDYDNDGDLDLFVANDSMANFLFQNQGNGTFREVGVLSGSAFNEDGKAQAGMGVTMGDYDHDGLFDFYVTHFSDDYGTLYRNIGNGIFRDVSYSAELAFPSWKFLGWGTSFLDFDNDGWEDLFVATGHVYPQVDSFPIDIAFAERKLLFKNLGNGKFREAGEAFGKGLTERWSSRGAAFADFDNDGDIDVAVNNMDSRPSLLRNDGGNHSGHWILLGMEGVQTNRSAIGVRVTVETQVGRQIQEVHGGSSYQATNDLRLHFGLGAESKIKRLLFRWTTGKMQTFENVEADKIYSLREGDQLVVVR